MYYIYEQCDVCQYNSISTFCTECQNKRVKLVELNPILHTLGINTTPSDYEIEQAIVRVLNNYGICETDLKECLESLVRGTLRNI